MFTITNTTTHTTAATAATFLEAVRMADYLTSTTHTLHVVKTGRGFVRS